MLLPVTLRGTLVRLEPMTLEHVNDLSMAAAGERSTFSLTRVPNGTLETTQYVNQALSLHSSGTALPFVVRHLPSNKVVGTTRFLDIEFFQQSQNHTCKLVDDDVSPTVVEIGNTWYAPSVQRTGVNAECKLLLLTHAFETWKCLRVSFQTDVRNQRSRAAIERIGATFEGIRRKHSLSVDGTIRDTVYYSILADEWTAIRANLENKLRGIKA